jgi:diphthine-ammonia ligase
MASLQVIALVSGGKDSFFSILHCLAAGHIVVALANLHPPIPEDGVQREDLNSFMYQTVGHSVIPLYAEATGIPLFRQEILGGAVNSARDYTVPQSGSDLEETESLVPLLLKIKAAYPGANAVSTGAILSTYQRTRVESVALRLGLAPLSFLWQYPLLPPYSQSALLHDMRAVGQDSRIIKVASGGLDETFLWQNVADFKTVFRLGKAMARFCENGDGAILGEGGEFETLAIDGPDFLWKRKIEIEPDRVIQGEGGEAIWEGKSARLADKEGHTAGLEALRIPELWDDEFKKILLTLPEPHTPSSLSERTRSTAIDLNFTTKQHKSTKMITISNQTSTGFDPAAQLKSILTSVVDSLAQDNLDTSNILHTILILRSMSDFAAVNAIYGPFFTTPNPPSRVTVACGERLPAGVDVMLSAFANKTDQEGNRKGLHVQSRSYWAPANIGPYSQAISTPLKATHDAPSDAEEVFIAGQIPLVPATMEIYNEHGFKGQTLLALQHLTRIGRTMKVGRWVAGIAFISSCDPNDASDRVHIAQAAWSAMHIANSTPEENNEDADAEEAQAVDPWDMRNIHGALTFDDTTFRSPIPNPDILTKDTDITPPCFVVQVSQLPRNATIEWSAFGLASATSDSIFSTPVSEHPSIHYTDIANTDSRFAAVEVTDEWPLDLAITSTEIWDHATLYAGPDFPTSSCKHMKGVSVVPCDAVWGHDGKKAKGVLIGRCGEVPSEQESQQGGDEQRSEESDDSRLVPLEEGEAMQRWLQGDPDLERYINETEEQWKVRMKTMFKEHQRLFGAGERAVEDEEEKGETEERREQN